MTTNWDYKRKELQIENVSPVASTSGAHIDSKHILLYDPPIHNGPEPPITQWILQLLGIKCRIHTMRHSISVAPCHISLKGESGPAVDRGTAIILRENIASVLYMTLVNEVVHCKAVWVVGAHCPTYWWSASSDDGTVNRVELNCLSGPKYADLCDIVVVDSCSAARKPQRRRSK